MKKPLLLAAACAMLLQACAPATPTREEPSAMSSSASTPTPGPASLTAYYWDLASATDASGAPIAALEPGVARKLRLAFTDRGLSVHGGCNTQFGGYRYENGVLRVASLASTMKACEQSLMQLDAEIGRRLKGELRATLQGDAAAPRLALQAQDGAVLRFSGVPTPETRYGSVGETLFLEVAAQRVQCSHPLMPDHRCLSVRERRYAGNGVPLPAQEDWHPLYQSIDGYTHRDGVRTVLRVKRYEWKNPPADAPSHAYVLDMVVEQETGAK